MRQKATNIPKHVAIIIDGNRRWARSHSLPIMEGHRKGYSLLKEVAEIAFKRGVEEFSAYVFSTENWSRAKQEVKDLMTLTRWVLKSELNELHKKNIRVRVSGLRDKVAQDILKLIDDITEKTKNNTRGVLNLCFNYGGRPDILQATRLLISNGTKAEAINEKTFAQALSTAGLSDVDLVIRTSEYRLSNFLPWETTYAEFYFIPDKYWPDFTEQDFDNALVFFATRKRRLGV